MSRRSRPRRTSTAPVGPVAPGASGIAISLVNHLEKFTLDKIAREFKIPFEERKIPSDEDVAAVVAERTTALLEARLRDRDKLLSERSRRFTPLARSLAESEDELPIITMLLDDYYQQTLHSPAPQPVPMAEPSSIGANKPPKKAPRKWGRSRDRSK